MHLDLSEGQPIDTYRGGGVEVSQVHVGNFAFQIGRKISHMKSGGFCEIYRTLAADTVPVGVIHSLLQVPPEGGPNVQAGLRAKTTTSASSSSTACSSAPALPLFLLPNLLTGVSRMINRKLMCILTVPANAAVTVVTATILLIVLVIPLWHPPPPKKKPKKKFSPAVYRPVQMLCSF